MSPNSDHTSAPGQRGHFFVVMARNWQWLVEGLAAVGTGLILVLMIIIFADVIARKALGASLPLVSELGALLPVMIVSLQLATTVHRDRLARTEIFYLGFNRSYPRGGALLSALFNIVGAGVIGGIALILLYLLLFFRVVRLVTKSSKAFGAMVAFGLGLSILMQAFMNIAVNLDLVPVTGLTLPLVSMGGTSILFTCVSFGIILSVSKYIESVTADAT